MSLISKENNDIRHKSLTSKAKQWYPTQVDTHQLNIAISIAMSKKTMAVTRPLHGKSHRIVAVTSPLHGHTQKVAKGAHKALEEQCTKDGTWLHCVIGLDEQILMELPINSAQSKSIIPCAPSRLLPRQSTNARRLAAEHGREVLSHTFAHLLNRSAVVRKSHSHMFAHLLNRSAVIQI